MTEDLARVLAEELPRAHRRMWTLLAVAIVVMAAMLVGALLLIHQMASSFGF